MLILTVLLSITLLCLIASVVLNLALYKAGYRQIAKSELYEEWILDFKKDVEKTYDDIKLIDNRQMFEKDDDVGVVFQDMLEIIKKLNDRVHEDVES